MKNFCTTLFFFLLCVQLSLDAQLHYSVRCDYNTDDSSHVSAIETIPGMVKECKTRIQYECAVVLYWMIRFAVNETVPSCTATLYDQVKWIFSCSEFKEILRISRSSTTYRKLLEQAALIAQESNDPEVWSIIKIAIENLKRRPQNCIAGGMAYVLGVASGVIATICVPEIAGHVNG